jgi:nicotinamidase-related amidase
VPVAPPLRHFLGATPRNGWTVNHEAADLVRPTLPLRPITLEALPKTVRFDLARTALIVIDMQNDFCHGNGWLASLGVDTQPLSALVAPLNRLTAALRQAQVPRIWLNWGNRPDHLNISPALFHVYNGGGDGIGLGAPLPPTGSKVLEVGQWGSAIVDELVVADDDIHVAKYRMSGFWDTPLDSILRNLRIDTLLFAGVNLDQCVLCTLQDANFLGYDCILLQDCCATSSPAFCTDATLYNVKQCFGFVAASQPLLGGLPGFGALQGLGA